MGGVSQWRKTAISKTPGMLTDQRCCGGTGIGKYNVYATPTLFLLNREKKIIAKPETPEQLLQILDAQNK